jgi:hypothetical protein
MVYRKPTIAEPLDTALCSSCIFADLRKHCICFWKVKFILLFLFSAEEMRMHVAAMTDDTSSKADNPTANIVSGLCYTTELLHIVANILHTLLPRRILYR